MKKNKKELKPTPTVYFMVGLPGSGKSTFVEKIRELNPELPVVSTDNEIEILAKEYGVSLLSANNNRHGIQDSNGKYLDFYEMGYEKYRKKITEILAERKSFIWDQTNVVKRSRVSKISRLRSEKYNIVVVFIDIGMEEWKKRLSLRNLNNPEKFISDKVRDEFIRVFSAPEYSEGMTTMYFIQKDGSILKIEPKTLEKNLNNVSINNIMNM